MPRCQWQTLLIDLALSSASKEPPVEWRRLMRALKPRQPCSWDGPAHTSLLHKFFSSSLLTGVFDFSESGCDMATVTCINMTVR